MGTMEAVSRGAAETGGHVVGITCDEIEAWRPVGPNPWVQEQLHYPTLRQRLYALIDSCDAALAARRDWHTGEVPSPGPACRRAPYLPRLILIGPGWQA
jgi:hypothetical protein